MIYAAGLMLLNKSADGDRVLFIQRAHGDHVGEWCLPGGKIEPGETAVDAAIREVGEEIGPAAYGNPVELTRRISDEEQVDFTTFVARTEDQFLPILNGESTAFAWAPPEAPPEPLHPGCRVALARLNMNELDIARAIASGDLASPQWYRNVMLVSIRITGTGSSYRGEIRDDDDKVIRKDEFVWRDPSIYLNDEFLSRCNGLAVVWVHPKTPALNSEEFKNRNIGSIMLPYIKGGEVWGIAKIYDDEAIGEIIAGRYSTSPGVIFDKANIIEVGDDTRIHVETDPSLLDHIAIVPNGVWDRGGPPSGVDTAAFSERTPMAEDTVAANDAADNARKDGDVLAQILGAINGLNSRMDAMEANKDCKDSEEKPEDREDRKDAEEDEDKSEKDEAEDSKDDKEERKDSEDKKDSEDESFKKWASQELKEKEHRADAALAVRDAKIAELQAQLAGVTEFVNSAKREVSAEERDALAATQSRADSVAAMFGERVAAPLAGENSLSYRRRMLERFKKHSARFAETRMDSLDGAVIGPIEEIIYADAVSAARGNASAGPGLLFAEHYHDEAGRKITKWHGDPMAWMQHFMTDGARGSFQRNQGRA